MHNASSVTIYTLSTRDGPDFPHAGTAELTIWRRLLGSAAAVPQHTTRYHISARDYKQHFRGRDQRSKSSTNLKKKGSMARLATASIQIPLRRAPVPLLNLAVSVFALAMFVQEKNETVPCIKGKYTLHSAELHQIALLRESIIMTISCARLAGAVRFVIPRAC